MGKGDKKSRKGKIFMGSYGITRPRKNKKVSTVTSTATEGATSKVASEKKTSAKRVKAKE